MIMIVLCKSLIDTNNLKKAKVKFFKKPVCAVVAAIKSINQERKKDGTYAFWWKGNFKIGIAV